jgi:hypothetical protein
VKPCAGLEVITNAADKAIGKLAREDMIVVCRSSNDIGKNASTDSLRRIPNFVESRKHSNIMIMNAPHRYNLIA